MDIRRKNDDEGPICTLGDMKPGTVFRFASFVVDGSPHDTLYMKVQLSDSETMNPGNARCVSLIQGSLSWKAVDRRVIPVKGYFQEVG